MTTNATLVKHLTSPSIYSACLGFSILVARVPYTLSNGTLMLHHLSVNLTDRKWDLGGIDSQLSKTIQTLMTNSLQSNPYRNPHPPPHPTSALHYFNKDLPGTWM
jgi:hypothetical protein